MSHTHEVTRTTPALLPVSHPWFAAIGLALVPVVFTALGSAAGQLLGLTDTPAALLIAAAAAVSTCVGLLIMATSGATLSRYGFRSPANTRAAWWFLPPVLTVLLVLVTGGVTVSPSLAGAYLFLCLAVALNEEVFFRGLVLALLRPRGTRTALFGSAVLFGILHLANLAGGQATGATLLQLAFAALFGFVAAELVIVSGSLWPVLLWHFAWDFTSFLGGNSASPVALAGVGIACVIMLVYAVRLWPHAARTQTRAGGEQPWTN